MKICRLAPETKSGDEYSGVPLDPHTAENAATGEGFLLGNLPPAAPLPEEKVVEDTSADAA